MSAVENSEIIRQSSILEKDYIDNITKKNYGLSNKNLEEIYIFINEFEEVLLNTKLENATHDDLRPIVDKCNKIPAHCGFIVTNYFMLS